MQILCFHCGGQVFHLVITDDGRSELRCAHYDEHIAEEPAPG